MLAKMMVSKSLLLAAVIVAALLQLGQGEASNELDTLSLQSVEELGSTDHNVDTNDLSKSRVSGKISAPKKQNEVNTASKTEKESKNSKPSSPAKSPVSVDEALDKLLQSTLNLLEGMSQELHNAVEALTDETAKEEAEGHRENENELVAVNVEGVSPSSSVTPDEGLRYLDRFVGHITTLTRNLLKEELDDKENGLRQKTIDEHLEAKRDEITKIQSDMFSLLASFMFQGLPAMDAMFQPSTPSFLQAQKSAIISNNPKVPGNSHSKFDEQHKRM